MKKILLLLLAFNYAFGQTYLKPKQIQPATGTNSVLISGVGGIWESQGTNQFQNSGTSVSGYTLTGTGTPSLTFIVSGQIRNPLTGVVTVLNAQTFSLQAVTHFTNMGVTYFGVKDDMTLTQQVGRFTTEQKYNHLAEWVVVYNTTAPFNIIAFNQYPNTTNQIGQQFHNYMKNAGPKVLNGGQYSGLGTTSLTIQREAAVVEAVGWGDLDSDNPNEKSLTSFTSAITFDVRMSTGTYTTNQTVIDPTIYEVSTGSVIAVPNPVGNVTVYRLTFFNSNLTRIQMGQTVYADIDQAVARTVAKADAFATEQNIADNGITVTYLAIQKNCTNWTQTTRYRFFPTPQAAGGASASLATLQNSYLNSTMPQIVVNDTKGQVQIQSARATNTTSIFEGLNIAGTTTYSLTGEGRVSSASSSTGYLELRESASPGTPTNAQRLYVNTSNQLRQIRENGLEAGFTMIVAKDITNSAALTGTTAITLIKSVLIPANTFTIGDVVDIESRAIRNTNTGTAVNYMYVNTSSSLSGATLIGQQSAAVQYYGMTRNLYIKSATNSETTNNAVSVSGSSAAAIANPPSNLNIDWTVDQYIISAFANAANGDSTVGSSLIVKKN